MLDEIDGQAHLILAWALLAMIGVADRRGEDTAAGQWRGILASLTTSIEQEMVYELDGKPVYREMLLPSGRKPVPFEGMGWINLARVCRCLSIFQNEVAIN